MGFVFVVGTTSRDFNHSDILIHVKVRVFNQTKGKENSS